MNKMLFLRLIELITIRFSKTKDSVNFETALPISCLFILAFVKVDCCFLVIS